MTPGMPQKLIIFASEHVPQQLLTDGHYISFFSAMSYPLQMKDSMRSVSANNSVATETMDNKCDVIASHREAVLHYHESTPCIANKKNWYTKKSKVYVCVLYAIRYAKRHLLG